MAKLTAAGYRFPAPADGVQVNFCKNVSCEAFGVSESLHRVSRAKVSLSRSQGLHPRGWAWRAKREKGRSSPAPLTTEEIFGRKTPSET